jgi:hypothetical protein
MSRARFMLAAVLVAAGVSLLAQGQAAAPPPQGPKLTPLLAGKTFTPPVRGTAEVEFLQPVTKRDKDMVITTVEVKNVSKAPIARLRIDETWYDKAGNTVAGGQGAINGLLQPGETQTVTIQTQYNKAMAANNWNFTHANGAVKPSKVDSFDPAEAAAIAAKKAAKKK